MIIFPVIYVTYYETIVFFKFLQFGYFQSIPGIISIIYQWSICLIHCTLMIQFLHLLTIYIAFQTILIMAIFKKLNQIKNLWLKNDKLTLIHNGVFIKRLQQQTIKLLILICQADSIYGTIIFLIILANGPINTFFVMKILFDEELFSFNRIIYYLIIFEQILFVFLLHIIATRYNKYLHYPCKCLINQYVYITFLPSTNYNRIKCSLWFEKFHTKNPYGFTYAGTGLITMKSFVKVSQYFTNIIRYLPFIISFY